MTQTADETKADETKTVSFAETALKLSGKSDDESRRTGAIDQADDDVETLFASRYQTTSSPAHRAVWDDAAVPVELFNLEPQPVPPATSKAMDESIEVAKRFKESGQLYGPDGKLTSNVLNELASVGYWGLLVEPQYGGTGAPFSAFAPFLTRMSLVDATVAGLASVHGCIGAVDPVRQFGTPEQKERFLPEFASGRRLSAFALTEPCAGSDLTALRTTAVLKGDQYLVTGEKLFITNALPGRTIGLVCLIEDKPAVLIVDLPETETDEFQLRPYGLHALKHTINQGLIFRNFPVPKENLLTPTKGDGLTIAYHGLNLGRTAVCASAAGNMRTMLAGMLPWAKYRTTYGAKISTRELVLRRIGRMGGLIVAADAMTQWCSSLIDQGFRGEMECIVAKIFGSESQKEAAIELFMKTHGGRSFLHGHLFGDNIHDFLAPCIYEGEGEMLGMAFFKSLVKHHGVEFFEQIGKTLYKSGIKKPNLANPAHLWLLREPMAKYARWLIGKKLRGRPALQFPAMPDQLRHHAEFAAKSLSNAALEISGVMRKYQLGLADRQCRMAEISARVQTALIMLCTSLYAARQSDELVQMAGDCICQDFARSLTGKRPTDREYRAMTRLGEGIRDGGFTAIAGVTAGEILMTYDQ